MTLEDKIKDYKVNWNKLNREDLKDRKINGILLIL